MKSEANLATLLLLAVVMALAALNPTEAYKTLEGLAGGAASLITEAAHGAIRFVTHLLG